MEITVKIKENIHNLIHNDKEYSPETIFFLLDDHLGLIDEEYYQCIFPEDEYGGVMYDSNAYAQIEALIFSEIKQQLKETNKDTIH